VTASARDVHLMVQGDVNPLLRRIAMLDVIDVSIATLEVEDVFLGFYDDTTLPDSATPPVAAGGEAPR
jgi:hypothetical protein